MVRIRFVALALFLCTGLASAQVTPASDVGPELAPGPAQVEGLVETTFGDPDWVVAVSDLILRQDLCLATFPCEPDQWYDRTALGSCHGATRYWKFAPDAAGMASVFPLAGIGGGSIDGLFVRGPVTFQLYQGSDTNNPVGGVMSSGQYVSVDLWQPFACDGFEAGTFFVTGGPGELSAHSITLDTPELLPVEGGVRVAKRLPPGGFVPGPSVLVDGVPATRVVVSGNPTFGHRVSFTPPPHAAGVVQATVFDGSGFSALATLEYTSDVVAGVEAVRRGVEVYFRELLEDRPDDFEAEAPTAGALGEVVLHGILRRAQPFGMDPVERAALGAGLEGLLESLRDFLRDFTRADGTPVPNLPRPILRPATHGQALDYPFRAAKEIVLMTLGTGTLVLSDAATNVPGGEVTGGRLALPPVDGGLAWTEIVTGSQAYGWNLEIGHTPDQVVEWRDWRFQLPEGGQPLDDVAASASVPSIVVEVNGVDQVFRADLSHLSHVYINEAVTADLPAAPGQPVTTLTEWLMTATYRLNLDGSPLVDNAALPALVVRQSLALSAPFDHEDPTGCRRRAQAYPRVSWSLSIPNGAVSVPTIGRVRVDHRWVFEPQDQDTGLPASQYVAAFTAERDAYEWGLLPCTPVPLWFNAFESRLLAHLPLELPNATTAPVQTESFAFSPNHDAFVLHHVHPDAAARWSSFGVDPVVEAPGASNGAIQVRWRHGAAAGPDFGGGEVLHAAEQDQVFGLVGPLFPANPLPDFRTALEAKLVGPGGDAIATAPKTLFVGSRHGVPEAHRQVETTSTGFAYDAEPATAPCAQSTWIDDRGGWPLLQLDLGGAVYLPALLGMQAAAEILQFCVVPVAPAVTGLACDDLRFDVADVATATPLMLPLGVNTVTFTSTPVGAFAVGAGMITRAPGHVLAETEGAPGSSLTIAFASPVRSVLDLALVVDDAVGPAMLTIQAFSGATALGSTPVTAVVPAGAPLAEAVVSIDPGQTFDSLVVTSDAPTKEFAIGGFRACSVADTPGDLNQDGTIDALDLDVLAACSGGPGVAVGLACSSADLDGDGDVDCDDVAALDVLAGGLGVLADFDGDGFVDACDNCPSLANIFQEDCDGDGLGDVCEVFGLLVIDCNGNLVPDECDIATGSSLDCNANGLPDECEPDCNGNGIPDACDLIAGTSLDCAGGAVPGAGNGIPDECEPDCNSNAIPDDCEIADGTALDCNGNGIPDACDLSAGTSTDCNGNGIPDECELPWHDCNGNGILDSCDLAAGTSLDCNLNGFPDECEPDCNGDGVPDACEADCNGNLRSDVCDIVLGFRPDCNANGVPDDCDLAAATSLDCNANGIPDECDIAFGLDLDCNGNGVPDSCDLATGSSLDCNDNGVPDECEPDCNTNGSPDECDIVAGISTDCNLDGIPDECQALIRFFVNTAAGGNNNGSSWNDAYLILEDALTSARLCSTSGPVEVWVAAGIYAPTRVVAPGNTRSATFEVTAGISLYGGFVGGETSLAQRNPATNVTVLSGDIDFDKPTGGGTDENAYHVLTYRNAGAAIVLDGFTITAGNGNGSGNDTLGAGVYCLNSSPTIRDCKIRKNMGLRGQGIYVSGGPGTPLIQACTISDNGNLIMDRRGAGIYVENSDVIVRGCLLDQNLGRAGSGVYVTGGTSSATIENCTFTDNGAQEQGGAVYLDSDGDLTITNCVLSNNDSGLEGGAIWMDGSGALVVTNTPITDSDSGPRGGAIYTSSVASLNVTNCPFEASFATEQGGAVYHDGGPAAFVDCDFLDSESGRGGALYLIAGSDASFTRCDFDLNVAGFGSGGSIFAEAGADVMLQTCTFQNGTAFEPGATGGRGGAVYLEAGTVLSGDDVTFSTNTANKRGGAVYHSGGTLSLTAAVFDNNVSADGGAVYVAPGVVADIVQGSFTSDQTTLGNGGAVFVSGGSSFTFDAVDFASNTASGVGATGGLGGAVYCAGTSSADFTDCTFSSCATSFSGGAVYSDAVVSQDFTDCAFDQCSATQGGGALQFVNSSPTLTGCTFTTNLAPRGAAIRNVAGGSALLLRCTFDMGTGAQGGGAVFNSGSSPVFDGCRFLRGTSSAGAGGVHNIGGSNPTLRNCLVALNSAGAVGCGLFTDATSTPTVVGCTFVDNNGPPGAGIHCAGGGAVVRDTILWSNGAGATEAQQVTFAGGAAAAFDYNCVQHLSGGLGGTGNIGLDPLFANQTGGDFHLLAASPCIDAGDPGFVPQAMETDFDGEVRVAAGRVDIGADEYLDCNANGVADSADIAAGTSTDCNFNSVPDDCEALPDCNANAQPDVCDLLNGTSLDCNGNGVPDECDIASGTSLDCGGNGIPDECEPDCNGNGVPDACDLMAGTEQDCNGNGVPDSCDIASGTSTDCNGNGIPGECENDCNGNCIGDDLDIAGGASADCNANGTPDECEIASGAAADCNGNGVPDDCEVDCNANGVPDDCDIAIGTSADCNGNSVPDECEFADCNANCVDDALDISSGTSLDCNGNGIPDECDLASGAELDCNANGVPDSCDLVAGTSLDCNGNGVPDECDIASGTSNDCNTNGIPDDCEFVDCNGNCVDDGLDVSSGTSEDCNGNGQPDECDISSGSSTDLNQNGVPDDCESNVSFVDSTALGNDDGTSWQDAFPDLESALAGAASAGGLIDQIWVAAGTYVPSLRTIPTDARSVTFRLVDGVTVYGGFAGTEISLGQRDPVANVTTLNGDTGGGVGCYHVVTGGGTDATAVLDGFTIRGGNANNLAVPGASVGGGVWIQDGGCRIVRCTLRDSSAFGGGASCFVGGASTPDFEACAFTNNSGNEGPAMLIEAGAVVSMSGCTVANNSTSMGGAVLCRVGGRLDALQSSWTSNSGPQGGGILNDGGEVNLVRCQFASHTVSGSGAALLNRGAATADLELCSFTGNSASAGGGAMFNRDSAVVNARGCSFLGNTSSMGSARGAGVYNTGTVVAEFRSSSFVANVLPPGAQGAGMFTDSGTSLMLQGCTFGDNSTGGLGGGLYVAGGAPAIVNCVFWDNFAGSGSTQAQQIRVAGGSVSVDYSCVEGWTGALDPGGVGNVGGGAFDPVFVNAAADDYHLQPSSPCRDIGDPAFVPLAGEADVDGHARLWGLRVDMGSHEVSPVDTPSGASTPIRSRTVLYGGGG